MVLEPGVARGPDDGGCDDSKLAGDVKKMWEYGNGFAIKDGEVRRTLAQGVDDVQAIVPCHGGDRVGWVRLVEGLGHCSNIIDHGR